MTQRLEQTPRLNVEATSKGIRREYEVENGMNDGWGSEVGAEQEEK